MPSLRESQGIKKDVSGNRNAKKLPINMICIAPQKRVQFSQKKKRLPFLIAFSITEMEGFELPTSKYSRAFSLASLCRCTPYFSQFRAPSPCHRQRSPSTPAPPWRDGFYPYFSNKKRLSFDSLFSTEMEGFEPSRHVNDLYP